MILAERNEAQAIPAGENRVVTDTRARSLFKAVSYRVISSLLTGSLFFGATQQARLAVVLALIDSVVKIGVFYIHERAWMKILFGHRNREGRTESRQLPTESDPDLTLEAPVKVGGRLVET